MCKYTIMDEAELGGGEKDYNLETNMYVIEWGHLMELVAGDRLVDDLIDWRKGEWMK